MKRFSVGNCIKTGATIKSSSMRPALFATPNDAIGVHIGEAQIAELFQPLVSGLCDMAGGWRCRQVRTR
ncbi:hypothetical protein, partial [Mesorhizobium sp. M4A.F.Ca.ET.020.02.1.1]|uniref:hypothetical protein n=1 Tax=Mesorhizobium sp. M4A.F.Ca.ET.020.02.1.1 TaxID=2496652 RepID=UPI001AECBAC3